GQRRRAGARIADAQHLEQGGNVELLEGVVVPALVAKVKHQVGAQFRQVALQGAVVVEVAELVARHLRQRILELAHGIEVFRVEGAAAFDLIRQAVVAHHHGDVEGLQPAAVLAHEMWRIGGQQDPPRHHAKVLVAVGQRLGMAMVAGVAEAGLVQQLADTVARVEPLGIELVRDYAHLVVDDNLARDQAFPVLANRALAADEMVLVDPLPRPAVEVVVHVAAVGNVQDDLPARPQDLADRRQHLLVILLVGEVAERGAHDGNAVHAVLRQPRIARLPLPEQHLHTLARGALLGQPHQIARTVEPHDVLEAAPRQLQAMATLAAAQVEDVAIGLDGGGGDDEVHLATGVLQVFDDVAVGLHIKGIEEFAPPLFGQVRLEVGNRAETRTGGRTSGSLRLRRHYHGGQVSSSVPQLALARGEVPDATRCRLRRDPQRPQQNANVLVPRNPLSNFYLWTIDPGCKHFLSCPVGGNNAQSLRTRLAMKKPSVACRAGVRSKAASLPSAELGGSPPTAVAQACPHGAHAKPAWSRKKAAIWSPFSSGSTEQVT